MSAHQLNAENIVAWIEERRANMDNLACAISREMHENHDEETFVMWTLQDKWNDLNNELQLVQEALAKNIV